MSKTNIRRPRISDEVRGSVLDLHGRDFKPTAIRKALGKHAPSKRSIERIVKGAKRVGDTPEFQALERTWHLGLTDPPLPADAIARVLNLKKWLRSRKQSDRLTVRQVRWISRLHVTLRDNLDLWEAAQWYDSDERASAFLDRDSDTSQMDAQLAPGIGRKLIEGAKSYEIHRWMRISSWDKDGDK